MKAYATIDKNWILDLAEKFRKYQPIALELVRERVEELKQRKVLRIWYRNRWEQIKSEFFFLDGSDLAALEDFADIAAETRLYDMTFPKGVELLAKQAQSGVSVDDAMMRRLNTLYKRVQAVARAYPDQE